MTPDQTDALFTGRILAEDLLALKIPYPNLKQTLNRCKAGDLNALPDVERLVVFHVEHYPDHFKAGVLDKYRALIQRALS